MHNQIFLPISINIADKKILVIGGGKAAWHKLGTLLLYTNEMTVIAPKIDTQIQNSGLTLKVKKFDPDDLDGAFLVYACVDSRDINQQIADECRKRNILCNICDYPSGSDFVSPAIFKKDNMSVAVSSNGLNVKRSIGWRNKIKEVLNDQPDL